MRNVFFTNRLILVGMLFFLAACGNNKEAIEVFREMNATLTETNEFLGNDIVRIQKSLDKKLADPLTAERTRMILPKVNQTEALSSSLYNYIEDLKQQVHNAVSKENQNGEAIFNEENNDAGRRIFVKEGRSKELASRIGVFKNEVFKIDPELTEQLLKEIDFDRKFSLEKLPFSDLPAVGVISLLINLQTNLRLVEQSILQFLDLKIGCVDCYGFYESFQTIAVISSSYAKPGEQLVISAGVGDFVLSANPRFVIKGKEIPVDKDGLSRYIFQAPNKPGSYSIEVSATYVDPAGLPKSTKQKIDYIVAKPCN